MFYINIYFKKVMYEQQQLVDSACYVVPFGLRYVDSFPIWNSH